MFSIAIADSSGTRSEPVVITLNVMDLPNTTTATRINFLANDLPPAGLNLVAGSVTSASSPSNVVALVNTDGGIDYAPASNFVGTDELLCTVRDNGADGQAFAPTRVTIMVWGSLAENAVARADVTASGELSPIDVLLVINILNHANDSQREVDALVATNLISLTAGPYVDVDGNDAMQPLDALLVTNSLNRRANAGSSELMPYCCNR